ncbi:3'(2'),5'-bisphosphate nucleotidase CysQ [Phaeovulum vinaykumarii]|uniref:Myo-inositol-1(Or 4)-monophosphatase n=1 Tax=Phaeovulum vinaykumarii TaxID=407234 RepID=A0A1N7MBR0_9RHOB|nr:3'(2'),5'-bisphosphate nucleotidase CysQ [Phaeovulum vinaykumarii]SIS83409.1 myo-inositol-1(or 4)-monophosphatase [Phaeovulum vinaykumarii]SOC10234.1 myo-inositol-1(or 4)-monophosphatase [Phaeovulum vinaykumarii]
MPGADLALLHEAAETAARVALRFWRAAPQSWEKPDGGGPVSQADLAVDAELARVLRAARPGYGWLSEESPPEPARLRAGRVFVVDPIDGTRAFLEGQEGFSISLAVIEAGRPIAALVHLPARGISYAATADGPALRDGHPIRASAAADLSAAQVLTSTASAHPGNWRGGNVPVFRRAFRPSIAWRLCLVAEGRFDATLSLRPAWEWDIAAGALIAERAGARVTDRLGGPLAFNRAPPQTDGIVAAPAALHSDILGRLARWPG